MTIVRYHFVGESYTFCRWCDSCYTFCSESYMIYVHAETATFCSRFTENEEMVWRLVDNGFGYDVVVPLQCQRNSAAEAIRKTVGI